MVAALAERLGLPLARGESCCLMVAALSLYAANEDLTVVCEARAHQDPPKSAQRHKVSLSLAGAGATTGTTSCWLSWQRTTSRTMSRTAEIRQN
jgi:hypothetical protein